MEFRYASGPLLDTKADLAVIGTFAESTRDPVFEAANEALGGVLEQLAKDQDFEGKEGQVLTVYTAGALAATHFAVLGLGDKASFRHAAARDHGARVATLAQQIGAKSVVYAIPETSEEQQEVVLQLSVEGALLGTYRFDKYRTKDKKPNSVRRFSVMMDPQNKSTAAQTRAARAAIQRAQVVAEAVCRARDFVNEPAGDMTPTRLAEEAQALAKSHGLKIKVMGRKECERLGMGMFLAVARGSEEEPKLIHLTYTPRRKAKAKVVLVGKGVMFDSGGYSLKPSASMLDMKTDMAGAAAVISAMGAIAALGSPYEVHAVAACCENMVSGAAYRLGDVLRSMDGTTVEITNTDAEGRLTLGDAITYARTKIKPDEIFDFATLTGACVVALGPYTAGVMSDSEEQTVRWLAATERAGEDMWRLPLNPKLREQLKSNIADMRNTGERTGGAITAGLFLKHFAGDSKWVHVDIAGPSSAAADRGASVRGGTGFPVASIVEYITRQ